MLRIAVIGGGNHSRSYHLPALARYDAEHPGAIRLTALCDLRRDVAENVAREYGFAQWHLDVGDLLATAKPDACIAVTPMSVTAEVAGRILTAGVPLLMEKPPGRTPEEARAICDLAARTQVPVMVSVNRRFDPALVAARAWRASRPLEYLRASMFRHQRPEGDFFTGTALHALDAMRGLAGDIRSHSVRAWQVDGAWWYRVDFAFDSGATGTLEVLPTCGNVAETYEMFGAGYRVCASAGLVGPAEVVAWEDEKLVLRDEPARGEPAFVNNGTLAETTAFLDAVQEGRAPHPSPREVWQSVDLCHRIQREAQEPGRHDAGGRAAAAHA